MERKMWAIDQAGLKANGRLREQCGLFEQSGVLEYNFWMTKQKF